MLWLRKEEFQVRGKLKAKGFNFINHRDRFPEYKKKKAYRRFRRDHVGGNREGRGSRVWHCRELTSGV